MSGVDDIWTAELVDMQRFFLEAIKYILLIIDVFSKYGRATPFENKDWSQSSFITAKIMNG